MIKVLTYVGRLCLPSYIYASFHPSEWARRLTLCLAALYVVSELLWICCSSSGSKGEPNAKSTKKLRKIKILCTDDDHISRSLLKKLIAKMSENIDLRMANDGGQGLQLIGLVEPDVIFLDMLMDKMNGNEMVREVERKFPKYLDKIIVMSSLDSKSKEVTESIFMGCDYIKKPVSPDKIRNAMNKVLDRYNLRANLNVL